MSANFWRDRRASIGIAAAVVSPVLIGLAGLATEYGSALLAKAEMQRISDLAAFSGALAYNATGSAPSLNAAVSRMATLNGVAGAALSPSLVNSPTGDGNQAVLVIANGNVPLGFSRILRPADSAIS